MKNNNKDVYLNISTNQIEAELNREKAKRRNKGTLKSTIAILIVAAAATILIATLLLPVMQISGNSMNPTLKEDDIVFSYKTTDLDYGDICGFYYSNKILIKRIIAKPLDTVDIDGGGNVYINGSLLDEPYIDKKSFGDCDIKLPYQVPEGMYFVMGDNRSTSIDSRNTEIGCVSQDEIIGKVVLTVWPPADFGIIK